MDFPERPTLKHSILNVMEENEADKITRKNTGKWMHIKGSYWRHLFMKASLESKNSSSLESKNSSSFILCVRKNGKWDIIQKKGNIPKITEDLPILASECGKWIDTTLAKCLEEYGPIPF